MDFDDDDPELSERPDDSDLAEDPALIPCPYCKRDIVEDSPQCPYCGSYLSLEDRPRPGRSWWWYVAVGLLVLIILRYTIRW